MNNIHFIVGLGSCYFVIQNCIILTYMKRMKPATTTKKEVEKNQKAKDIKSWHNQNAKIVKKRNNYQTPT